MTALAVQDLTFGYNGRKVLRELDFSVPRGSFFIVIGPNGSGKTTLMRLLAGVMDPAGGRITVLDRPLRSFGRKRLARHLAYVPQLPPEPLPFTVQEAVLMGRAPYLGLLGVEGKMDAETARRAMRFTRVDHLADRRLSQISGGEQQRVLIARAVCQEPDILLLDEPTAFLDLAHQIQVMDLLERLKTEQGVTVVMVSHDLNLAAMYGDRLLLLKGGRAVGSGPPNAVLTYTALEDAYECVVLVDRSPLGDFPRVTPVPKRFESG
ncbi:MAG: ABC transporter ATP-binding protein [Desulfococcaceae bacterium]